MNATAAVASDADTFGVGERAWWSDKLWTVTERDGVLARLERVGTVGPFDCGVLWADTSLLEPCTRQERA